ncbi:MAG: phosphoglucosamine mutase [Verrucomicrobia bacterium]|nr:phosphoglucosamine mutase [Verrucomicrobiota bacterium]
MKVDTPTGTKLFGTDGVRGKANIEPVTAETALKLGRAAAHVFRQQHRAPAERGSSRHKIVIGKDTRLSGYMLETAMASGILSMGVDVLLIGPLPTPGVAYITRSLRADAAVMLTASHNPYDDNGIKFFDRDGYKLDTSVEEQIEELVFSGEIDRIRPTAEAVGKALRIDDALGRYIEFAKASFPRGMTLDGYRIAVDAANGAGYKSTPCVLRELGAEVFVYGNTPNGTNINKDCGSLYPTLIREAVIKHSADIGIAHDGDADRVILCDEHARVVDGDEILAIAGVDMLRNNRLRKNTLVATILSNMGLDEAIRKAGGQVVRTSVGDKFVIDEMRKLDLNVGGEQSGHIIFRDFTTAGDGLISALQILGIMRAADKPLSELARVMSRFPQVMMNVSVRSKPALESLAPVQAAIKEAEAAIGSAGRVMVRYSGTESLCRVTLESRGRALIERHGQRIADAIRQQIGAE